MGRCSGWGLAPKLWRWTASSSSGSASRAFKALSACSISEEGLQRSIQRSGCVESGCRKILKAGMATKSGDGDNKGTGKWRQWVEGKLAEAPSPTAPASGSTTPAPASASPVDDFERYVLGKTGEDEEGEDTDFHDFRESVSRVEQSSPDEHPEEDDFLQELTKIERGGVSFPDNWGRKKDQKDDMMMKRGYDDGRVPFDDEIDPENDESMLHDEEAVFWNQELRKFVTPKGLLNLPGVGTREDIGKPYQLRPDRQYFPGQTIEPEDFDITRIPSNDLMEAPMRTKKAFRINDVLAAADFRNIKFLSQFLSETSRLLPRRNTSVSWKCQRKIVREIKTARALGLIPFTSMGDPPFRYLKDKPAKDIDPEEEYQGEEHDDEEGGGRFRRRLF